MIPLDGPLSTATPGDKELTALEAKPRASLSRQEKARLQELQGWHFSYRQAVTDTEARYKGLIQACKSALPEIHDVAETLPKPWATLLRAQEHQLQQELADIERGK